MESDPDLNLETDRLEQLLETPPPPQSVVVVEYRNRGVPTWIFFPLIVLIPLGVLLVYDRMVTQRDRFEAAQTRQSLENLAAKEGAGLASQPANAAAASSTPAGTLYIVQSGDSQTSAASVGRPPATSAVAPTETASVNPDGTTQRGPAASSAAVQTGAARVESPPTSATNGPPSPLSDPPADAHATNRITVRSILPNPFADGIKPPQPPDPSAGAASRPAGTGERTSPVAGQSEPGPRPPAQEHGGNDSQPVNGLASPDERLPLQPPLPTKEESERQIREEAAKLQADRVAQVGNRVATQHSHWMEEQIKFREELAEVLRTSRNQAGPDIDKLAKRYDGETDPVHWAKAYQAWFHSRGLTQSARVKYIRALEVPEAVILEFICAGLHRQIGKRDGPRDENDVRVRAATQLLQRYPFPVTDASLTAGGAAQGAAPARAFAPADGTARP
jgi:hypothetical protein